MPINCQQCRELFSSFYDDDLRRDHREALLDHLARCNECREHYRSFEDALGAVARHGSVRTAPGFVAQVVRRAQAEAARPTPTSLGVTPRLTRSTRLTLAAATLAAVAILSYTLGRLPHDARPGQGGGDDQAQAPATPSETPPPVESTTPDPAVAVASGAGEPDAAPPQPVANEAAVRALLASWGFEQDAEGRWMSPREALLERALAADDDLIYVDGKLVARDTLIAQLREEILAELPERETLVVQPPARAPDPVAVAAAVRTFLLERGFVERHGHWYSETEARLLDPDMACLGGRILSRTRLKEELAPEILAAQGLVRTAEGRWIPPTVGPTATPGRDTRPLAAGDLFWAPDIAPLDDEADARRGRRLVEDLGTGSRRAEALRLIRREGSWIVHVLNEALADARKPEHRRAIVLALAWHGVETPEITELVTALADGYVGATSSSARRDRYHEVSAALLDIGLMAGRILERRFTAAPDLRTAELLTLFGDPHAERTLLEAWLGRPNAPVAGPDTDPFLVEWWLERPASGAVENLDLALALLRAADERERLLGLHLVERIAYRNPIWAEHIAEAVLRAAETSYCGCIPADSDSKEASATIAGCRLHEQVAIDEIPTATAWIRDADRAERQRLRVLRGAAVAADAGRILSNLSGERTSLALRGDRLYDPRELRLLHISTLHNWRLQLEQHGDEWRARWERMAPLVAAAFDAERAAPWRHRNTLLGQRTETRGNRYDTNSNLAGIELRPSDRVSLPELLVRFLARVVGDHIDPSAGWLVPVREPASGLAAMRDPFVVEALGMPILDGLVMALAARNITVTFDEFGLDLVPAPSSR